MKAGQLYFIRGNQRERLYNNKNDWTRKEMIAYKFKMNTNKQFTYYLLCYIFSKYSCMLALPQLLISFNFIFNFNFQLHFLLWLAYFEKDSILLLLAIE